MKNIGIRCTDVSSNSENNMIIHKKVVLESKREYK